MTVDERGLTVSVPWRTSDRYIARFLQDSAAWVLRKLETWESRRARPRRWDDGESIDYLGRQLRLEVTVDPHRVVQLQEAAVLSVGLPPACCGKDVHAAVVKWYRRHAQQYFRSRVEHYSARLGIEPPRVFLSMRNRAGVVVTPTAKSA